MTESKTYTVRGAQVIVTASVYSTTIDINITVDLHDLDSQEPDHSSHNLIRYFTLSGYSAGGADLFQAEWWRKAHRKITVRTGAQASRVVRHALTKIDDAIGQALIDRDARKAHMGQIFA
jgi:hypothetical protein